MSVASNLNALIRSICSIGHPGARSARHSIIISRSFCVSRSICPADVVAVLVVTKVVTRFGVGRGCSALIAKKMSSIVRDEVELFRQQETLIIPASSTSKQYSTISAIFIRGPTAPLRLNMNSDITSEMNGSMRWHSAPKGWAFPDLRELWEQRSLINELAARDIRIRYRQTFVGVAWALLQPLAMTLVFVTFFQLLGRNPSNSGTPFAVTLCCGLVPWQFFTNGVSLCTSSLVTNQQIITKVYFPRMVLPVSTLLAAGADMAIALLVLAGLFVFYSVPLTSTVLILPFFVAQLLMMTLSLGLWLAAANALYRDVEQAVPFFLQIMFFLSPVVYETAALVPPQWRAVFLLNPVAGVIEGFRWSLLGEGPFPWLATCTSLIVTTILLAGGLFYFRRVERFVADRI